MRHQTLEYHGEQMKKYSISYFHKMCPDRGGEEQKEERRQILKELLSEADKYSPKVTYTFYPEWNVVIYGMCIPDEEIEEDGEDILRAFYLDCWKTALLDGARDYLREKLQKEYPDRYVSYSFGPGFQGIGVEALPDILKLIDASSIGLQLFHGCLTPAKACLGFYRIQEKRENIFLPDSERDCTFCLSGGKNCIFCKGYHKEI